MLICLSLLLASYRVRSCWILVGHHSQPDGHVTRSRFLVPGPWTRPRSTCARDGLTAGPSSSATPSPQTQYDRLASLFVGNVEVWRTSTPEPTRANGIVWSVFKDVSKYMPLFSKRNQPISFNLNNVISLPDGVDASYYITLSATFYRSTLLAPKASTADAILPLTNLANSYGPDVFATPPDAISSVTLPRNVERAFVEITASGNCPLPPRV